jgi:hypothetical protein
MCLNYDGSASMNHFGYLGLISTIILKCILRKDSIIFSLHNPEVLVYL